jgi:hypothetical protein
MDRRGASMDAWDWEVLPDHMSSSVCLDSTDLSDDQETKEPMVMPPSSDAVDDQETKEPMITTPSSDEDVQDQPVDEFKDIGVVLDETKPTSKEEAMPEVTDPSAPDGEEEGKTFQSPDDAKFDDKDEEAIKKDSGGARRPECVVFSVGKLKVNGIGALCSFGIAAATVCIFLIGGKVQHHHRQQQQHKIQLQFYGDDKRIQQVVQQTSRLNQAMSSVIGGGASARANISFGGSYDDGF